MRRTATEWSAFTRWLEQVSHHDVEFRILQPMAQYDGFMQRAVLTLNQAGKAVPCGAAYRRTLPSAGGQKTSCGEAERLQQLVDVVPQHIFVLGPDGSPGLFESGRPRISRSWRKIRRKTIWRCLLIQTIWQA